MQHHNDGDALSRKTADYAHRLFLEAHIHGCCWLIKKHHWCLLCEHTCEGYARTLTTGKRHDFSILEICHAGGCQRGIYNLSILVAGSPGVTPHFDDVSDKERKRHSNVLQHHCPGTSQLLSRGACDVVATHLHAP